MDSGSSASADLSAVAAARCMDSASIHSPYLAAVQVGRMRLIEGVSGVLTCPRGRATG